MWLVVASLTTQTEKRPHQIPPTISYYEYTATLHVSKSGELSSWYILPSQCTCDVYKTS